jgi:hypothetical protein
MTSAHLRTISATPWTQSPGMGMNQWWRLFSRRMSLRCGAHTVLGVAEGIQAFGV